MSGSDTTVASYAISFNTGSANYIENVISSSPQVQTSGQTTLAGYLYKNYKTYQSSQGLDSNASASVASGTMNFAFDATSATAVDNLAGYTPSIQSQLINGSRYNLFQIYTRSHGTDVNSKYVVVIANVKSAATVPGSNFGSFSLQVRKIDQVAWKQKNETVVESWDDLNFNPTSTNYFARVIGDRYADIDNNGKLTYNGDWPNKSNHIYIRNYSAIADGSVPVTVVPMGFAAASVTDPTTTAVPVASYLTAQVNPDTNVFNSSYYYGWDNSKDDNRQYLAPVPNSAGVGNNVSMSLEDMTGDDAASTTGNTYASSSQYITLTNSNIKQRQFGVPFQGAFDGDNPANPKSVGVNISSANTMGFNLTDSTTSGSVAYKKAINAVSNPDEFDINMLVTPGIIHKWHSIITNHAIDKMEARGDAFYVLDSADIDDGIDDVTDTISALDTNYAATYYPWVKIADRNTSLPVWVPPGIVLPGVIAYTDRVSHEWFAPAGLNRGGLTTVLEAKTRLTHDERDTLYENRVNPIASFPAQGVVVWGQKTLQALPSALDRVNVRRLLIKLKKYIASTSRYLVFEQNNSATRTRFLNMVNPFLESVQQNSGLTAFQVVMDETNNTPDVIDRNKLVGQIFIQPTRTAEFIVLDFIVVPTGATFPS